MKKRPGEKRDTSMNVRLKRSELERWRVAASESGLNLSEFTRRTLDYLIVYWAQTQHIHNSGGHTGGNHSGKLSELLEQLFPSKRN